VDLLAMSVIGTFLPCQPRRAMSGFWSTAVEKCSLGDFLILTDTVEKVLVIFGEQ
jgi:hypothetical protein